MVSIHCSYAVTLTPSELTPIGKFRLFHFDQIRLSSYAHLVYIYKTNKADNASSASTIEILRASLSRALVHYYKLAGRLCETEGGSWEVNCNARGAAILEANCGVNLDDSGGFLLVHLMEQIMPYIDYVVRLRR